MGRFVITVSKTAKKTLKFKKVLYDFTYGKFHRRVIYSSLTLWCFPNCTEPILGCPEKLRVICRPLDTATPIYAIRGNFNVQIMFNASFALALLVVVEK